MTKERIYYIAYSICNFLNNRDIHKNFEPHELCMYVTELAQEIEHAAKTEDYRGLEQYYETLNEEVENLASIGDIRFNEAIWLISLLDEVKEN